MEYDFEEVESYILWMNSWKIKMKRSLTPRAKNIIDKKGIPIACVTNHFERDLVPH